jgi:steroid 5-alpha reductase family enzyme
MFHLSIYLLAALVMLGMIVSLWLLSSLTNGANTVENLNGRGFLLTGVAGTSIGSTIPSS